MRRHGQGLAKLAALLVVPAAFLAGCTPQRPERLVVYAPANSIIAAPPAADTPWLPDGPLRSSRQRNSPLPGRIGVST